MSFLFSDNLPFFEAMNKCLFNYDYFCRPTLPTIKERANPHGAKINGATSCRTANVHRMRSNSECSEESMISLSSEDSEDSNEEMMEEEDDSSEGDSDRSVQYPNND